ncbi:MAG: hypothetical protein ICV73_28110 [Acetobacteraceae bacterium]|nr:hypothetical protein [Acetobacteraceae bacterium]
MPLKMRMVGGECRGGGASAARVRFGGMSPSSLRRILPLAAAGALAVSAAAPAATSSTKITGSGAGGVKLGATYKSLREKGLVGKIRQGCELAGPNTRSAPLRKPLSGSVDFTQTKPRRVVNITVDGGGTARGVGIGATIKQIKAAFPKAKVDHSSDETFQFTLVRIPKKGPGDRLHFAVSTETDKVIAIGVPYVATCE